MKYTIHRHAGGRGRSGRPRIQLQARNGQSMVVARVSISEGKAQDPVEMMKAMAKLQRKMKG